MYLTDDGEARISLESFVDRYPEIDQVVYFANNGRVLQSFDSAEDIDVVEALSATQLQEAIDVVGHSKPYLMRGGLLDPRLFEILAPIWIESIPDDGLFGFDATNPSDAANIELLGFVELWTKEQSAGCHG